MTSLSPISSATPAAQTSASTATAREAAKAQTPKKSQPSLEDLVEISPAAREAYGHK